MRSIQSKLMLYIILMGVIPMLVFTFYYYDISTTRELDKLNAESQSILKQLDNKLTIKTNRLQTTADILFDDEELYRILCELGSLDKNNEDVQNKLDKIYDSFLKSEREIKSILLFPLGGGAYISGKPVPGNDPIRFAMMYDSIDSDAGILSWLGFKEKKENPDNNDVVAGIALRDKRYRKDYAYLASIYIVFNENLFGESESLKSEPEIEKEGRSTSFTDESVSVYDDSGKAIYSFGNKNLSNAFLELTPTWEKRVYDSNIGNFPITMNNEKYMVLYHTSSITGWKFVRTVPYAPYLEGRRYIGYITALILLIMFGVWFLVNFFVIRKMTVPIRQLGDAMRQVGDENFDVQLAVKSKDEFGLINRGFNAMVLRIKSLFEQTLRAEEKRRKQDILMLRYQMNPHFLYNTLGAIRLTAIMEGQKKIARMLLIMARFLRNAILTANEMLEVKSEVDNINDYLSLYQVRYNDKLHVSVEANPDCLECLIPSMLCQPIIENSIMHGLCNRITKDEEAKLNVKIYEENENLIVSVFDNGCGMSPEKLDILFNESDEMLQENEKDRLHIGLRNVHKRIKLIFGDAYGLDVDSVENEYTLVKLRLPKKKKDENNFE